MSPDSERTPKKEEWLFLRGLAREAGHWGAFVSYFEEQMDCRVHCIDLPGTGEFLSVRSPWSVSGIQRFVREEAFRRGLVRSPLNILSISLGGMVTMEWLRVAEADIGEAVIMNSSASNLCTVFQRLQWQSMPSFFSLAFKRDKDLRERAVLNLVSQRREAHEEVAHAWSRLAQKRPITLDTTLRHLWAASRFHASPASQRRGAESGVILLAGQGDQLVHPGCSEKIHQAFQWPIARHPWAGHDLPIDDSDWVVESIRHWRAASQ